MSQILQVPIFPLPDVVLFPRTVLPLHVFEPRYRRLVNDVLGGDRRFAVFLQRPDAIEAGEPPPFDVGCLGEIVRADAVADGRFHVLLLGLARVRIRQFLTDVPYRVVGATLAAEEPEVAAPPADGFRGLTRRYFRRVLRRPPGSELDGQSLEALVNTAAANLRVEPLERQRLLESATLSERMGRVAALMEEGLEVHGLTRRARDSRPPDPRVN